MWDKLSARKKSKVTKTGFGQEPLSLPRGHTETRFIEKPTMRDSTPDKDHLSVRQYGCEPRFCHPALLPLSLPETYGFS